ncbi:variant SH3 domain-containing protein [Phthorimaea operculella]|nr:variant SH3 domain-containing protein [Phthorimaea operculella]
MGSSIPLFIFVMSLLCIVSGSDPAYGDDYCAKLAKVEMTIIHYWKQKQDVVFKSFMTYAIQFNESDYDLTENCSFVMMQKFPNGMVPDKLQWHRDHLLSAFNKEPNAVYVFFNKILPKKRNYFTWMRITCGKFGIKCDSNMPHVWVPEIYMGNCPDWRTQRCKMFHFMLNCEMKVRKECNWYWYKIPVHRPDKIKFKHIRMRPVKIQKKNKGSMSYGMSGGSDTDSLSRRLREAERARADAERAHADALAQLRNAQHGSRDAHNVDTLQSRVRELEKKAALETVRCEELQLELSAALRARGAGTSNTWSHPTQQPASEIERIMAKIEQDNRILAELEHTRSTTHGMQSSGSNQALGMDMSPSPSPMPHSYGGTTGHTAICQSSTMPTLSALHATGHNMGQLSSNLAGLQNTLQNITAGNMSGMNYGGVTGTGMSGTMGTSGLTSALNNVQTSLSGGLTSTLSGLQSTLTGGLTNLTNLTGTSNLGGLNTSLAGTSAYGTTGTYTNPLLSSGLSNPLNMNMKIKPLDDIDLGLGRYGTNTSGVGRVATPVTPHQPSWNLGLDSQFGTDRLGGLDSSLIHDRSQRALSRIMPNSAMEIDVRNNHYMNGGATEGPPTVDMLDIPGKGRCCVYIARFSYDPPEIESAEGELSICAGDYLLVWGPPDSNAAMLDAELLDGRRGLVPANFVQRLVGEDLLEFHQAVVATLKDAEETVTAISDLSLSRDVARLSEVADLSEGPEDDDNVPAPRQLTLERQLNKSVLIGWTAPEGVQQANIDSYHVYVDGVLKTTVKATERTRALVEGVDSNRPHRISVRSVTVTRRTSRDAACTMVIGRDTANMGPTCVRASGVTCSQAIISWLPANSNHQHVVCVNNVEVRTVKPGVYRHTITGLSPSTQYRVTVRAKHLRAGPPSGVPIEEAPGAYTDFRTLPKGLPDPPAEIMLSEPRLCDVLSLWLVRFDVPTDMKMSKLACFAGLLVVIGAVWQVEAGPQDGTLLVTWQPVLRPPASGPVTGYAVYADGKKVTDVDSPTGDHALIDIGKLIGLNPKCVTVRTKSRDSQSSDSQPTPIPPAVLRGVVSRMPRGPNMGPGQQINQGMGQAFRGQGQQQRPQPYQQHQQVIEHDENLSDKEIFPSANRHVDPHAAQPTSGFGTGLLKSIFDKITPSQSGIPAIEITKEGTAELGSEEEEHRRRAQQQPSQPAQASQQPSGQQYPNTQGYHGTQQPPYQGGAGQFQSNAQQPYPGQQQQFQHNPAPRNHHERGRPPNPHQQQAGQVGPQYGPRGAPPQGPRGPPVPGQRHQQGAQSKRSRYFIALFDYDPVTMSPNPESCDEELPFSEGDTIKVWGDKDADGFYWGECRGRRGYVPHNMVMEVSEQEAAGGMAGGMAGNMQGMAAGMAGNMQGMAGQQKRGISDRWADAYANQPVRRMVALYDYDPQELSPNVDADAELSFQTGQIIHVYGDMDDDGFFMAEIDGQRGLVPSNFLTDANDQYGAQQGGQGGPGRAGAPGVPGGAGRGRGAPTGPGARGPPPPPRDNAPAPRNHHRKPDACPLPPSQLDHNTCASNPEQANSQARGRGAAPGSAQQPSTIARTSAGNAAGTPPKFTEMTAPGGDILSKGKELIFMKFGLGGK